MYTGPIVCPLVVQTACSMRSPARQRQQVGGTRDDHVSIPQHGLDPWTRACLGYISLSSSCATAIERELTMERAVSFCGGQLA